MAKGAGSALAVIMRRAQLWPPCRTELLFRHEAMAKLCPAGNTVLLWGKACKVQVRALRHRMGSRVDMRLLLLSPSHSQTFVLQGLGRDWVMMLAGEEAPTPSSAGAVSAFPLSPG